MPKRSPLPPKKSVEIQPKHGEMDFFSAIKQVIDGKKIHKLEWEDREYYGYLIDEVLCLHTPDGDHSWVLSLGDLGGKDYIVI